MGKQQSGWASLNCHESFSYGHGIGPDPQLILVFENDPLLGAPGVRRSTCNHRPRRLWLVTLVQKRLGRQGVHTRRRRKGPTDRERADRRRWRGESASRNEVNLLTVRNRINFDGLKLSVAASAGQSEGSYGHEEDEGPEPAYGNLLLNHFKSGERKQLPEDSGLWPEGSVGVAESL